MACRVHRFTAPLRGCTPSYKALDNRIEGEALGEVEIVINNRVDRGLMMLTHYCGCRSGLYCNVKKESRSQIARLLREDTFLLRHC